MVKKNFFSYHVVCIYALIKTLNFQPLPPSGTSEKTKNLQNSPLFPSFFTYNLFALRSA